MKRPGSVGSPPKFGSGAGATFRPLKYCTTPLGLFDFAQVVRQGANKIGSILCTERQRIGTRKGQRGSGDPREYGRQFPIPDDLLNIIRRPVQVRVVRAEGQFICPVRLHDLRPVDAENAFAELAVSGIAHAVVAKRFRKGVAELGIQSLRHPPCEHGLEGMIRRRAVIAFEADAAELGIDHDEILRQCRRSSGSRR